MRSLIISLILTVLSVNAQINADNCLGTWLVAEKNAKVEIYKIKNEYRGKIVWLKDPNTADGKPKSDKENPNENLKTRGLLGLEFLWGFVFDSSEKIWKNGHIYDASSGKTYTAQFSMNGNDVLNLKGYIGFTWLGRTSTWTRVK